MVDSKNIRWIIGSRQNAETKDINDSHVSWDKDSKKTKLNVQPTPTQTTSYGCQYVGADTNSTATVKVLGLFKFISYLHITKMIQFERLPLLAPKRDGDVGSRILT